MTRGRQPLRAQDAAIPIAEGRGLAMRYQYRRGNTCDMTIMIAGLVVFVTVKRLDRLTCLPEDIAHDFSGAISLLRFIVSSPGISRELWLCTPHGAWRFFRILDDRIIEIDRDGRPIGKNSTGPATLPAAGMTVGKNTDVPVGPGKESGKSGRYPVGTSPVPDSLPALDPAPEKNPESATISENGTERNAKPVNNPGQKKNSGETKDPASSVPDLLSQKNPEPEKDLHHVTVPGNYVALAQDSVPADDPTEPAEPEKVPDHIKKFLIRRTKGREKDPGSV